MRKSVVVTLDSFLTAFMAVKREEQKQAALFAGLEVLTRPLDQKEPLLTLTQIAAHYKVNFTTAWRWGLPWVEQRGQKRYLVSQCDSYFQTEGFKQRRLARREERQRKAANNAPRKSGRQSDLTGEGTTKRRTPSARQSTKGKP